MYPEKKEGHTKWPDPNKIEGCSLCWLGEPVFELCQILLHPNLSLPVDGRAVYTHVRATILGHPPQKRPPTTEDCPPHGGGGTPGARSQGISRHGTDLIHPKYSGHSTGIINPLTIRNHRRYDNTFVGIVAADASVPKHNMYQHP